MSWRRSAALRLLTLVWLGASCWRSEERAADIALHDAITRLRADAVDTNDRRMRIVSVKSLPARSPEAKAAQTACSEAYRQLTNAQDAIFFAELSVKRDLATRTPVSTAPAELALAEQQLARAKEAMPACDAAASRLALAVR